MIIAALAPRPAGDESDDMVRTMEDMATMLPGMGDPQAVRIAVDSWTGGQIVAEAIAADGAAVW